MFPSRAPRDFHCRRCEVIGAVHVDSIPRGSTIGRFDREVPAQCDAVRFPALQPVGVKACATYGCTFHAPLLLCASPRVVQSLPWRAAPPGPTAPTALSERNQSHRFADTQLLFLRRPFRTPE